MHGFVAGFIFAFLNSNVFCTGELRHKLEQTSVTKMTAEILQTKTSPYFLRPLVSHIQLSYTPEEIQWHMLDPVDSLAILKTDSLSIVQNKNTQNFKANGDPKIAAIIKIIRAIVQVDLLAIEKEFDLTFTEDTVLAKAKNTPENSSGNLFKSLTIIFKIETGKDPIPKIVNLDIGNEQNHLIFSNVTLDVATRAQGLLK